jgi:hypothetical protein
MQTGKILICLALGSVSRKEIKVGKEGINFTGLYSSLVNLIAYLIAEIT